MNRPENMLKTILKKLFVKNEPEMVQYWKTKESVEAIVTTDKSGSYVMWLEGEKYPFPGFPRGIVLYKSLSKLKHEIKNQIFNDSWHKLENGTSDDVVVKDIKKILFTNIKQLMDDRKIGLLPPERMAEMPRELWRAMTVLEKRHKSPEIGALKEILCFILQEDDGYRFRVQWTMKYMRPFLWFGVKNSVKMFDFALSQLEHAEIIGDMKERIRLLRRILMVCLKDKTILSLFEELVAEWNWKKMILSKGDKFYFRGKWFKVDFPQNQY